MSLYARFQVFIEALMLDTVIVHFFKVDVLPHVEQVVGRIAYDVFLLNNAVDLVVVKVEPLVIVEARRCVVPAHQLPVVVRHRHQVVLQVALGLLDRRYHILTHVKVAQRENHFRVLLRVLRFEPFEVDYHYRWSAEDLYLFDSLLVVFAPTAEPRVLHAQLLREHELPKAVIYCNLLRFFAVFRLKLFLLGKNSAIRPKFNEVFVETPASLSIEFHSQLKL